MGDVSNRRNTDWPRLASASAESPRDLLQLGDVGSGDERAPRTGENDSADVAIRAQRVDHLAQLRDDPVVQRVELVRPVDRDRRDPVGDVERDRLVRHARNLRETRYAGPGTNLRFWTMQPIQAVTWSDDGDGVRILDQRLLPEREVYRVLRSVDEVCEAINTLAVRGAPAIGIAAAMGLALSMPSRVATATSSMALGDAHATPSRVRVPPR